MIFKLIAIEEDTTILEREYFFGDVYDEEKAKIAMVSMIDDAYEYSRENGEILQGKDIGELED